MRIHLPFSRSVAACTIAVTTLTPTLARPAQAQAVAAVDSLARAFKAHQPLPGLVIGLTGPHGHRVLPYGVASLTDSTPVSASTRFEIGSISKLFTSLILADMVQRGEVKLDDPIGRYLPDSVHAPTYQGKAIELWHLSTHTSGLPRLPTNIQPADMTDPYADYTPEQLYAFLNDYHLTRAPGAEYDYSNLGAGLLGQLLARRADTSYAALLERRVLEPLGLADTYVPSRDTVDTHLARGYMEMKPVPYWHFDALAGAGAIRSTASDLLQFLDDQIDPSKTPLADAIKASHEIHYRNPQGLALALAWHVISLPDSTRLFWHNGGTGGFRSFIAFAPDKRAGVVLLANAGLPLDQFTQFAIGVARAALKE